MRVMCGDLVFEVNSAVRSEKKIVFKTYNGKYYYTDDYQNESHVYCVLEDLFTRGYIEVNDLTSCDGYDHDYKSIIY